jgi:hypothetical protein
VEIGTDSGKDGLKSAIAELHDPSAPVPGSENAEQLQLLCLPLETAGEIAAENERRGPGRPAGAKNKNTEEWRKYLLTKYRSPLEALAQTYCMSVADLAKRLGLQRAPTFDEALELFKVQITAAKELAPYVHQKMPLAIDGGENGLIQLVINQGQAAMQTGQDVIPQAIKILNSQDEENQMLTDADFTESNKTQSNESEE